MLLRLPLPLFTRDWRELITLLDQLHARDSLPEILAVSIAYAQNQASYQELFYEMVSLDFYSCVDRLADELEITDDKKLLIFQNTIYNKMDMLLKSIGRYYQDFVSPTVLPVASTFRVQRRTSDSVDIYIVALPHDHHTPVQK